MITFNLASQFSPFPAGRYPRDGLFNGQKFRDDVLLPLLKTAQRVVVNIDGVATLPSSFWEETWGGMIRKNRLDRDEAMARFDITTSEPELERFVALGKQFLREAQPE